MTWYLPCVNDPVNPTVGGWYRRAFGSFISTATQTNAGATSANLITFSSVEEALYVSLVDNSKLTVARDGLYDFQFSFQVDKTDGGADDMDIWVRINGEDLPNGTGRITVTSNAVVTVPSWNYMLNLAAGDYVEFVWCSADVDMRLLAQTSLTNPTRPDIPSVAATVVQLG